MANSFSQRVDLSEVLNKIDSKGDEIKSLGDEINGKVDIITPCYVGDEVPILYKKEGEINVPEDSSQTYAEVIVNLTGRLKVTAEARASVDGKDVRVEIFINDSKVETINFSSNSYVEKSAVINVSKGDKLTIKLRTYSVGYSSYMDKLILSGFVTGNFIEEVSS